MYITVLLQLTRPSYATRGMLRDQSVPPAVGLDVIKRAVIASARRKRAREIYGSRHTKNDVLNFSYGKENPCTEHVTELGLVRLNGIVFNYIYVTSLADKLVRDEQSG